MYDYAQLHQMVYDGDELYGMKQDYVVQYALMMYYAGTCMIMHSYIRS